MQPQPLTDAQYAALDKKLWSFFKRGADVCRREKLPELLEIVALAHKRRKDEDEDGALWGYYRLEQTDPDTDNTLWIYVYTRGESKGHFAFGCDQFTEEELSAATVDDTKDIPLTDGDYKLVDGAAWFTVKNVSIRVHENGEKVMVDLYPLDQEAGLPLTRAEVFFEGAKTPA